MIEKLKWFNVGLRGLMELGLVVALGYWGAQLGKSTGAKLLLGLGVPTLVFGFWGTVDFHQAGSAAERLRLGEEVIVTGLAAGAWYAAGQHALGWALGITSIIHHILVYVLGGTLLQH